MKDELGNLSDEMNKVEFNCLKCSYSLSKK